PFPRPFPPSTLVSWTVSVRGPRNNASIVGPGPGPARKTWQGVSLEQAPAQLVNFESGLAMRESVTGVSGGNWNVHTCTSGWPLSSQNDTGPSGAGETFTRPCPPSTLVSWPVSVRGPRNNASTAGPGPGPDRKTWHGVSLEQAPAQLVTFESGLAMRDSVTGVSGGNWNVHTCTPGWPLSSQHYAGPSGAGETVPSPCPPSTLVSWTVSVRGPRNTASTT